MLTNDELSKWDRESLFHPSTHLGQFARGEGAQRKIQFVGVAGLVGMNRQLDEGVAARAEQLRADLRIGGCRAVRMRFHD